MYGQVIHQLIIGGSILMCKYMVVCFNETNKVFHFLVESADGYCAEIEVRKRFPNYKIGQVIRLEELK